MNADEPQMNAGGWWEECGFDVICTRGDSLIEEKKRGMRDVEGDSGK